MKKLKSFDDIERIFSKNFFATAKNGGGARVKIRAIFARGYRGGILAKNLKFFRANKGEWPRDHAFMFFDFIFLVRFPFTRDFRSPSPFLLH